MNQRAVRGSLSHTVCLRRLMEKCTGDRVGIQKGPRRPRGHQIRGVSVHTYPPLLLSAKLYGQYNNIWTLSKNRKT